MSRGVPNKRYTTEFKVEVIETMRREGLSHREAARQFKVRDKNRVAAWERIYLTEGAEGLAVERRGRASAASGVQKGRPPKLPKQVEEDIITENQRLRAENDYLKKLHALVSERVRREKNHK